VYFNGSSCFSGGSLGPCNAGVRVHFSLELSLTRGLWRKRSFHTAVDVAGVKAELLLTHWRGSPLVAARGGNENAVRCGNRLTAIYISVLFIHCVAALQSCDWLGGAAGTRTLVAKRGELLASPRPLHRGVSPCLHMLN
jgi:hypothetical protein